MSVLTVSGDVDISLNHLDKPVEKAGTFGDHRDYSADNKRFDRVSNFYRNQHINQTYEFAKNKKEHFGRLDKKVLSIAPCFTCTLLFSLASQLLKFCPLDFERLTHVCFM